MKSKSATWAGCFSIAWMAAGFAFTHLILERHSFEFKPDWLYLLAMFSYVFVIWWGVGLLLAISGMNRGNLTGRICALLAICAFIYSAWEMLRPMIIRVRY